MTTNIKIGDRVKSVCKYSDTKNRLGTVVGLHPSTNWIGIEFDEVILSGHSCDNNGKPGHCYYVAPDKVVIIEQTPVLSIKDQTMSTQKLTPFLEKSLTATQKNYYKLGWVAVDSADLRVTSEGQRALAQVMLIGEGDVAKFAASEVKRLEAEAKV